MYTENPELNRWIIEEEYSLWFTHEEIAWLDLHSLDECGDPSDALYWIVKYNTKEFLEMK